MSSEAGDVVLAVGVRMGDPTALTAVREAGSGNAAGLIFKLDPDESIEIPQGLVAAAESAGVALVAVPSEVAWDQLLRLIRTITGADGRAADPLSAEIPLGDLFALADAVAMMAGGPVTIEDPESRVLAYSTLDDPIDAPRRQTILRRAVPHVWKERLREAGIFRKLSNSTGVVRVDGFKGLRPRLAIAVRAGDEDILGSIWVSEGRAALGSAATAALEEAGRLAALHLIRHQAGQELEERIRRGALRWALEGRGGDRALDRLGIRFETSFTVLAWDTRVPAEPEFALKRKHVLDFISLECGAFHRRAASIDTGTTLYSVVPMPDRAARSELPALVREVIEHAGELLHVEMDVGIGSTVEAASDIPLSRSDADQVLRILKQTPGAGRVADIDDVRASVILLELKEILLERNHLGFSKLELLLDHDCNFGTSYVKTLRSYLEAFGDISTAASHVGVHPNTFRYRMRRLAEISGLRLDDPEERLVVQLFLTTEDRSGVTQAG